MPDRLDAHPGNTPLPIRGAFGPWLRALGDCERCAQLRSLAALAAVFVGSANRLVTALRRAGARRAAVQHPRAARGGIRGRATRWGSKGQHGGRRIDGRNVWDIRQIDLAFDDLPRDTAAPNSWDGV
jgi:hypothetical protein